MPDKVEFCSMDILVNHSKKFLIEKDEEGNWMLNGVKKDFDILQIAPNTYHILQNNTTHLLVISPEESSAGETVLYINGVRMVSHIKDSLEKVLENMGMTSGSQKVKELKSPMPGLVIKILVESGQEVKKDDPLLVLEAMKMENLIKSPADGIIEKIAVNAGDKTEKNQVLIHFA